jgi:hypothetical protein
LLRVLDAGPLLRHRGERRRAISVRAAAVGYFVTDRASRAVLLRMLFFPLPQRRPVNFIRFIRSERTDLAKFAPFAPWYVTMGDADYELLF